MTYNKPLKLRYGLIVVILAWLGFIYGWQVPARLDHMQWRDEPRTENPTGAQNMLSARAEFDAQPDYLSKLQYAQNYNQGRK